MILVEKTGAFPKYLLEHPVSLRGNHPTNSFTALGTRILGIEA